MKSETILALCILLILCIVLYLISCNSISEKEKFDTYQNHDFGAQEIYEDEIPDISVSDAALKAKYDWNKKDAGGYTVYDKYYERKNIREVLGDSYGIKELPEHDTVGYDTKLTKSQYTNYRNHDMRSQTPIVASFPEIIGADKIRLMQKEY